MGTFSGDGSVYWQMDLLAGTRKEDLDDSLLNLVLVFWTDRFTFAYFDRLYFY